MKRSDDRQANTEPSRLLAGDADDPVLEELGRWFAAAPPPPGLDAAGLARVAERLDGATRRRRPVSLRSVALGFAVVSVATASAAMWQNLGPPSRWLSPFGRAPEAPAAARRSNLPQPPATSHLDPTPELPTTSNAAPAPNGFAPTPNGSVPTPNGSVPPSSPAEPRVALPSKAGLAAPPSHTAPEHDLALESAALEHALTALRRDRDPARALGLLERYAADFPAGVLRLEADVARIDADLALRNEPAALLLLERVPLERVGRGLELRLVRAELLAKRDCRAAVLDFERVLAAHPARAFDERALYGRASCRRELGDTAGANADFNTYLTRYPDGRFATLVRSRQQSGGKPDFGPNQQR